MSYRLLSFDAGQGARAGILVGDMVYDAGLASGTDRYASVIGILDDWGTARQALDEMAKAIAAGRKSIAGTPVADAKLLAPVLHPGEIYAAGANYTDHIDEMNRAMGQDNPTMKALGEGAWHFVKTGRSSVVGPDTEVSMSGITKLDWELELAVVIGIKARNLSVADALSCVAGYTVANDLSARDRVTRAKLPPATPFFFDFLSQKCFDGSCPLGPWITPASVIPDPSKLGMKAWVNDELMQDSHTSRMIFDTAEQIAALSASRTLYPGDVILTGTPAGVGMGRGFFLKPGDKIRMWIEEIGELRHGIVE